MGLASALQAVRVIDFSQVGAGPLCGMLLSDMGAEVVKVEPPGGDIGRKLGPPWQGGESVVSMSFNRNKRSIILNLKKPEAVGVARSMAAASDVLLESFRPGVMEKLGIGYAAVSERNSRIVFCSVSAYGQSGPWRDKPGVDGVIQAVSGLMASLGERNSGPMKVQVPAADMAAGFLATTAVLAALRERERTGRGQHLDVSLYNSALMFQQSALASYLASGENPVRTGSAAPYSAPNEAYPTQDGWIMIAAYHEDRWPAFCEVLGDPVLATHPDFVTNTKRVANRARLAQEISKRLSSRTTQQWQGLLEAADIICAPILNYDEVVRSPQAAHNGAIVEMEHPVAGTVRMPGFALGDRKAQDQVRRPPPRAGEHAREVLAEFGFSGADIDGLLASGAVVQG
jgi:crotonobetainyl-CoA:carnitine CoA-transferase CaiB-like acyl-CoA transferase